jgi:hypothetical protein
LEAASADLSGESLFDRLLLVLHGLLSSSRPSWLKPRPASSSKSVNESSKDCAGFDRDLVESLQVCYLIPVFQLTAMVVSNMIN